MKAAAPVVGLTISLTLTAALGDEVKAPLSPAVIEVAQRAKSEFDGGHFAEAEKLYRDALEKAPGNFYLLSNLAVVHFRMEKFKLAEEGLKKAIAAEPQDDFSHCTLGIVYYTQGKLDGAIDELTKALAINPKNATAHSYLSLVATQKGWVDAARTERETAEALDRLKDSTYRPPAKSPATGDFLTPLEKSRLRIPPSGYRSVLPPATPPIRQ